MDSDSDADSSYGKDPWGTDSKDSDMAWGLHPPPEWEYEGMGGEDEFDDDDEEEEEVVVVDTSREAEKDASHTSKTPPPAPVIHAPKTPLVTPNRAARQALTTDARPQWTIDERYARSAQETHAESAASRMQQMLREARTARTERPAHNGGPILPDEVDGSDDRAQPPQRSSRPALGRSDFIRIGRRERGRHPMANARSALRGRLGVYRGVDRRPRGGAGIRKPSRGGWATIKPPAQRPPPSRTTLSPHHEHRRGGAVRRGRGGARGRGSGRHRPNAPHRAR
ncbi:hypothetical protein CDCA_CDCA04G1360 [Cyanidium caldarium]|uniref:Uncharacterized protein n=1 Tax=Cyanidium caldarium TaxID=2771 RepID=A0AAV9ITA2_CYACA|nr:hypothetical protein CDCA_CDCA04G1360 [Cyanidium caldarium]